MQPLKGTKVLDLSRLLPGPFASLILADLGAQVDKIEDTTGGDYLRYSPPLLGDQSGVFIALNRGKRSCILDLKCNSARDVMLKMVAHYDVLLEQFRPGVLDRLGLSHARLLEANPRLVICALTGYGQTGPLAKRAGHDINYIARAGILSQQGPADGPPAQPGFQIADMGGGLWCALGILTALMERRLSGVGRVVDISMMESAMAFAPMGLGALFAGEDINRGKEMLTGAFAGYGTYQTKDGKAVALGALEPKFWMSFCAGVGLETDATAFANGPSDDLHAKVAYIIRSRTRDEWVAFSEQHDCCLEPVLTPEEVRADSHVQARGIFFDLPVSRRNERDLSTTKLPQFCTPLTPRGVSFQPPPKPGEHSDDILREAGIDEATILQLRQLGALR